MRLEILHSSSQMVSLVINAQGKDWIFSKVYGSPHASTRKELWKLIKNIAGIVDILNIP